MYIFGKATHTYYMIDEQFIYMYVFMYVCVERVTDYPKQLIIARVLSII